MTQWPRPKKLCHLTRKPLHVFGGRVVAALNSRRKTLFTMGPSSGREAASRHLPGPSQARSWLQPSPCKLLPGPDQPR
eukprot:163668-Chlamydomonas_euryale.AAC.4